VARDRCRRAGIDVQPASIVVIGDTPLDVECARAHGVRAVAVATGPYRRQLQQDLRDTPSTVHHAFDPLCMPCNTVKRVNNMSFFCAIHVHRSQLP